MRAASFMVYCGLMSPSLPCAPGVSGNWIEIAYGTSSGAVRVIVQHPETVGSGPQLFQTFTVHRSPVTKIMLSEKHLVSGKGRVPAGEAAARETVPGECPSFTNRKTSKAASCTFLAYFPFGTKYHFLQIGISLNIFNAS